MTYCYTGPRWDHRRVRLTIDDEHTTLGDDADVMRHLGLDPNDWLETIDVELLDATARRDIFEAGSESGRGDGYSDGRESGIYEGRRDMKADILDAIRKVEP